MCVISDHLDHSTAAVHCFFKLAIEYLTSIIIRLKKMIVFSDGAASQYKNHKNIASLVNFKRSHELDIEWHFSASCHGKGAVDGIGATIKKNARLDSIRGESITTAQELYNWAQKRMTNIKSFLVTSEMVQKFELNFKKETHRAMPIKGMRSYHCFIPNSDTEVDCCLMSGGPKIPHKVFMAPLDRASIVVGSYVAYDNNKGNKWYFGLIVDIDRSRVDQNTNCWHIGRCIPDGGSAINGIIEMSSKFDYFVEFERIKVVIANKYITDKPGQPLKIESPEFSYIKSLFDD